MGKTRIELKVKTKAASGTIESMAEASVEDPDHETYEMACEVTERLTTAVTAYHCYNSRLPYNHINVKKLLEE